MIIILSAPSGCGKSSLAKELINIDPNLVLSISATTRAPRQNEIDGKDYFFKTIEEFKKLELLEQAQIYDNFYGTPINYIKKSFKKVKISYSILIHKAHIKLCLQNSKPK